MLLTPSQFKVAGYRYRFTTASDSIHVNKKNIPIKKPTFIIITTNILVLRIKLVT